MRILVSVSVALFFLSVILVKRDLAFDFRWIAFGLHIASLLILLYVYLVPTITKSNLKKVFVPKEMKPIICLLIIASFVLFFQLANYPYVSISDELRDGGLYTMHVASGAMENLFGYGRYGSHGMIIPTLTVPFYYLFGQSTLSYRFPAALLSLLTVLFMYILVRVTVSKQVALWSALALTTIPLYVFFAHTQVVVAFNFFWVPLILLVLVRLLRRRATIDYIFLGAIIGFACGFHAAIRVFALFVMLILLLLECRDFLMKHLKEKVGGRVLKLVLLACFVLVGFGPRIIFTGPTEFFHTSRLSVEEKMGSESSVSASYLQKIKDNYLKSIMVYTYEPTTFFYQDKKPVFAPILALFFVLGIGYSIFILKKRFLYIILTLLFMVPFLTSAVTDWINADHRLSPLLPIAPIFVGVGISYSLSLLKKNWMRVFAVCFLGSYLFLQASNFYLLQPANKNVPTPDYFSMHSLYLLQSMTEQSTTQENLKYLKSSTAPNQFCFFVSPNQYKYFNGNIGIIEQQQYLLPNAKISYKPEVSLVDNQMYIVKGNCAGANPQSATRIYTVTCSYENRFVCPIGLSGKMTIRY